MRKHGKHLSSTSRHGSPRPTSAKTSNLGSSSSQSNMLSMIKRRVHNALTSKKTITYGLQNSSRRQQLDAARPARRQFNSTFLASGSLRRRYTSPTPAMLRHMHVRAISYSSIPRFVARAFRVPIAGATIGAGGFGYANYRFEGAHIPP